jgi:uncharacterized protein (TIGR03083 family)
VTALQPLLAAELAALASALAPLDEESWSLPSLCEGWAVRNVVAHLTMAARYDEAQFGGELASDGFDFQKLSDRIAHRDGDLPPATLLADLGSEALATFEQPGGGWGGSISHVVIHGLDVTLPLGLGRVAGDEATRLVLDTLVASGDRTLFGVELGGRSFTATDLSWSVGDGTPLRAPAGELAAILSGRSLAGD